MRYAYCTVPAAPMRSEPAHRSEMVNQLLFGEGLELLEEKEEWFRVRSLYDEYEGWVTWHVLAETTSSGAMDGRQYAVNELAAPVQTREGSLHLPMGAFLPGFDPERETLATLEGRYTGKYSNLTQVATINSLINTAKLWLNAPYLWGGKTFMGVDCSGYVQTVFKVSGIELQRDAFQQAEQGLPVAALDQATAGDLAFFHNQNGRVIHVGILLNAGQIIHASGQVRIDPVDASGITHHSSGKRTHTLHSIRRVTG